MGVVGLTIEFKDDVGIGEAGRNGAAVLQNDVIGQNGSSGVDGKLLAVGGGLSESHFAANIAGEGVSVVDEGIGHVLMGTGLGKFRGVIGCAGLPQNVESQRLVRNIFMDTGIAPPVRVGAIHAKIATRFMIVQIIVYNAESPGRFPAHTNTVVCGFAVQPAIRCSIGINDVRPFRAADIPQQRGVRFCSQLFRTILRYHRNDNTIGAIAGAVAAVHGINGAIILHGNNHLVRGLDAGQILQHILRRAGAIHHIRINRIKGGIFFRSKATGVNFRPLGSIVHPTIGPTQEQVRILPCRYSSGGQRNSILVTGHIRNRLYTTGNLKGNGIGFPQGFHVITGVAFAAADAGIDSISLLGDGGSKDLGAIAMPQGIHRLTTADIGFTIDAVQAFRKSPLGAARCHSSYSLGLRMLADYSRTGIPGSPGGAVLHIQGYSLLSGIGTGFIITEPIIGGIIAQVGTAGADDIGIVGGIQGQRILQSGSAGIQQICIGGTADI